MRIKAVVLFIAVTCIPASAAGIGPVDDPMTKTECGACHMVYPAGLLPARSWEAITNDLAHHFGEDATLAPEVVAGIKAYLMANAGDAGGTSNGMIRNVPAEVTPLRISELPRFTRAHGQLSPSTLKKVGVAGNCVACHRGAADGVFEDD
jgi:hypothetical protein